MRIFACGYGAVAVLFATAAVWLLGAAAWQILGAMRGTLGAAFTSSIVIIESMGLLAVSLVALEIAQTIVEEQVIRRAHVSAPTRARRYLSRFLVVLIVAMTIEMLVVVFKALHTDPADLRFAAWIGFATAALLMAWGVFIRLNRSAEEIEPDAMEEAKREDEKLKP